MFASFVLFANYVKMCKIVAFSCTQIILRNRKLFGTMLFMLGLMYIVFFVCLTTYMVQNSNGAYLIKNNKLNNDQMVWPDDVLNCAFKHQPNIPDFYKNSSNIPFSLNETCAYFPQLQDIEYANLFWQIFRSSNGMFHFLNAYLDVRQSNKPLVRILAMYDRIEPKLLHCQFWFKDRKEPVITEITNYLHIWKKYYDTYKNGIYHPYIITCPLKEIDELPESVSLVENACDKASNNLKVIYTHPAAKKDFAICVKGLDFPTENWSIRLIEWMEYVKILGAHKIYFHNYNVHSKIYDILKYYEEEGFVDIIPFTMPAFYPNIKLLQHNYLQRIPLQAVYSEVIQYNDCFYKHMNEYRYILLLDTDEVIVPKNGTWKDLIAKYENNRLPKTTYYARNVYFFDNVNHSHECFDDIPKYMHMLQHVYRSRNYTGPTSYIKSFFNTDSVLSLHNHFPFECLNQACNGVLFDVEDAHLQHYRSDCVPELKKVCDDFRNFTVFDPRIWVFKELLIDRVQHVMRDLSLEP